MWNPAINVIFNLNLGFLRQGVRFIKWKVAFRIFLFLPPFSLSLSFFFFNRAKRMKVATTHRWRGRKEQKASTLSRTCLLSKPFAAGLNWNSMQAIILYTLTRCKNTNWIISLSLFLSLSLSLFFSRLDIFLICVVLYQHR